MLLENIALDMIDGAYYEQMSNTYRQHLQRTGRSAFVHGVNTREGQIMEIITEGLEECVYFGVFIQKIRRENEGLEQRSEQNQRAWYDMVKCFIEDFGEERTPFDIIDCRDGVKDYLGITD